MLVGRASTLLEALQILDIVLREFYVRRYCQTRVSSEWWEHKDVEKCWVWEASDTTPEKGSGHSDDCSVESTRDAKGNFVGKKSTFPSWIKDLADYVHSKGLEIGIYSDARYPVMTRALMKVGRPIFFSSCEWGDMHPALWGYPVRNKWRITNAISDNWGSLVTGAYMKEYYAGLLGVLN